MDIAVKDLVQSTRNRMTFLFFLVMPLLFTVILGYTNGAFDTMADRRLPVGWLDLDESQISRELKGILSESRLLRLQNYPGFSTEDYASLVADYNLAAALVIPTGYGRDSMHGKRPKMTLIVDPSTTAATSVKSETLAAAVRLENAVNTALIFDEVDPKQTPFKYILREVLARWENPPIQVVEKNSSLLEQQGAANSALVHLSPAMMLQFAMVGLMTAAQIMVAERKVRALQRMLTTTAGPMHILMGHYAAIFVLVAFVFIAQITFGQLVLQVDYFRSPVATLLVAITTTACISALGLLIGTVSRSEEHAVIFSMIPMFVFSGLGGAWVPLEATSETFQFIGRFTPVAWALEGLKNIIIRGWGLESVLLTAVVLLGYAGFFLGLSIWRFRTD